MNKISARSNYTHICEIVAWKTGNIERGVERKKAPIVCLLFALSVLVLWSRSHRNEVNDALNLGPFENLVGSELADQ